MKAVGVEVAALDGKWRELPLESAGRRSSRRARSAKGELFLYVQTTGSDDAALAAEVSQRIAELYYADPARSVTTSLTRALAAVNEELHRANSQVESVDRRYADASCLVLRGEEAYFALVGGGLAYVVTPEEVQALSGPAQHLSRLPAGLGSDQEIGVELFHRPAEGQLTVALGGHSLAEVASATALRQVLVLDDHLDVALALQTLFRTRPDAADARAVVVEIEGPRRRPVLRRPSGDAPHDDESVAEPPGLDDWPDEALEPGAEPPGEPAPSEPTARGRPAERDGARVGDRLVAALRFVAAGVRRSTAPKSEVRRTVVAVGVALILLFAIGIVPLRMYLDRQQGLSDASLIARAEQKEGEALAVEDPSQRLKLMVEANRLASQAAQARPTDQVAQTVRARTQRAVESLSGAIRLSSPSKLLALDGQPSRLVVGNGSLYVVDHAAGRIYRHALSADGLLVGPSSSAVVFRRGDRVGEQVTGNPTRAFWMPGGSGRPAGALLVVDDRGDLYEVGANEGIRSLRTAAPFANEQLLAGYAGSLFVLDRRTGALDWLPPGPDGYDRAAYPYLQPGVDASLQNAVELAVDGDLYVLRPDGRIDRFAAGRPQPFGGNLPDRSIGRTSRLLPQARSLFVLDHAHRRLVQLSREGEYRRQFVFDAQDRLVDLVLDASRGLVYYLGGQGLYLYRLGEPAR